MAARKKTTLATPSVDGLLETLEHPHLDAIRRIRALVLGLDPAITEEVKWNAPSFTIGGENFLTFHLRAKTGVMLILHLGSKKRAKAPDRSKLTDPTGLVIWLADDRAQIVFADLADVEAKRTAFEKVVRSWIRLADT